jgi:hypothetical protein
MAKKWLNWMQSSEEVYRRQRKRAEQLHPCNLKRSNEKLYKEEVWSCSGWRNVKCRFR